MMSWFELIKKHNNIDSDNKCVWNKTLTIITIDNDVFLHITLVHSYTARKHFSLNRALWHEALMNQVYIQLFESIRGVHQLAGILQTNIANKMKEGDQK